MLKMRNVTVLVGAALVLLCAGAAVQAEPTLSISSIEPGRYKTVVLPQSAALSITQNVDPATVEQVNVACSSGGISTENAWLRLFDLDTDHGAVGQFCAKNLDYAVEIATGAPDLNIRTYCLNEGLPFLYAFLGAPVDDVPVSQADTALEFFNVNVGGCCDSATQDMAVEVFAEDCLTNGTCLQFWLGANDNGQTKPSYIASASCGILDPTNMAAIGFPSIAVVYTLNGNDEGVDGDGDGDGDVPAVTGIGMLLMVLIVLGSTAFFAVRRRVTN
jgi:hypothetical protein